jgi:CelD/BcsL family acetyltransferase involved in cellulose biosynthesis
LRRAYRWRGYVRIRPTESFPSIPLDPTWREPERHFSARRRSDFRRARRKADAAGAVGFETLAPGPNELPALLDEAFAVETAGWKGIGGTSLAADRRLGGFFRRYAELAAEEGSLRLEFMRIDGRAVAMQLGVETNGRRYLFKIGYDERFSRCSPGTLLMLHSVGHAVREGAVAYEFLGHREGWTDVWTHVEMPCVAVRAYPFTAAGLVSLGSDLASVVANHLPQWMPFAS